jgi:hypothetical protein
MPLVALTYEAALIANAVKGTVARARKAFAITGQGVGSPIWVW